MSAGITEAMRRIAAIRYAEDVDVYDALEEALNIADAALAAALSTEAEGMSPWMGWDQARPPWGECKHKDAVLEALFRAPWSVEDAATLIGFIERTWPRAAPLPEDTHHGR